MFLSDFLCADTVLAIIIDGLFLGVSVAFSCGAQGRLVAN